MTLLQKTLRVDGKNLRKVLLGLFLVSAFMAKSQTPDGGVRMSSTQPIAKKDIAVGLNFGITNGIGVDVAYRFAKHFTARLAYNNARFSVKDFKKDIVSTNPDGTKSTQSVSFDANVNLSNLGLNFELAPGAKGRLKLVGGLAFFPTNAITAGGKMLTAIKFNDVQLTPDDLGSGTVTIGYQSKIAPYLGMSFGRTIPRKRMNISFDLGTYYKGDYKVDINIKQGVLLKENENNAAQLEHNLNQKWNQKLLPVMNLRLAYRL
jgi:hypothetical protein